MRRPPLSGGSLHFGAMRPGGSRHRLPRPHGPVRACRRDDARVRGGGPRPWPFRTRLTDHVPLYFLPGDDPDPGLAKTRAELPGYVEEVQALREEYRGRIDVLLGSRPTTWKGTRRRSRSSSPVRLDVGFLGSVHWVAGAWIDAPGAAERHRQEGTVFPLVGILAARRPGVRERPVRRPDASRPAEEVRRPGCRSPSRPRKRTPWRPRAAAGVAVEVSSAGLRKARRRGVSVSLAPVAARGGRRPLVLSSDAHAPAEVAWGRPNVARRRSGPGRRNTVVPPAGAPPAPALRPAQTRGVSSDGSAQLHGERRRVTRSVSGRQPAAPPFRGEARRHAIPDPARQVLRRRPPSAANSGISAFRWRWSSGRVDLLLEDPVEVGEVQDHPVLGVHRPGDGGLQRVVVAVAGRGRGRRRRSRGSTPRSFPDSRDGARR